MVKHKSKDIYINLWLPGQQQQQQQREGRRRTTEPESRKGERSEFIIEVEMTKHPQTQ